MKTCTKCGKEKPLEEFHRHPDTKDRRQPRCKACVSTYGRRYRASRAEREADRYLKRKYNITLLVQYNAMLEAQNDACAICGMTSKENGKRLAVDHNHETGKVRGLLCQSCNLAIGYLLDDPELCRLAADYLQQGSLEPQ